MTAYLIRRLLLAIPTLVILSMLVFLSVRFIPGDIVDVMMEQMMLTGGILDADPAAVEKMFGLDQPIYVQYGRWVGDIILRGSLGKSLLHGWEVGERILGRVPVTFELGLLTILIGLVIALPVGIYSAIRRDKVGDYIGRSVAIVGLATPNFWVLRTESDPRHRRRRRRHAHDAHDDARGAEAGLHSHCVGQRGARARGGRATRHQERTS